MNMPYRPPSTIPGNGGFNIWGGDPVIPPGDEFKNLMDSFCPPGFETCDPSEQILIDARKAGEIKRGMAETEAEAMERIKKQQEAMLKAAKKARRAPRPKPPKSNLQLG